MNTVIIEKILDVICQELTEKWYDYDTNTILRDDFVNGVMSYNYLIDEKWLEYLFTHINIECDYDDEIVDEITVTSFSDQKIIDYCKKCDEDDTYNVTITKNSDNTFTFTVYKKTNTIKEITCDYSYLSNYEYCDIFEK